MLLSIKALRPYFAELAKATDVDEVLRIGIEAEKAMLEATGGVNTHKGALFCLGITAAAAGKIYAENGAIDAGLLRGEIMKIASGIPESRGTHGADAKEKFGAVGALEMARMGYPMLFEKWLPFLHQSAQASVGRCASGEQPNSEPVPMGAPNDESLLKLLLMIMSSLDDTNVLHRAGAEGLAKVKNDSAALLKDFSISALEQMNKDFTEKHISPGGSADMLALTIFITFITN